MKISSVAENSQVAVDHPRAIVSRTEASNTTSYRFLSASGSLAANSAPTQLTATKAAPRFLSQAMFSVFAPSNSAYHSGMRKKIMPIAMLDQPQIFKVSTVLSISLSSTIQIMLDYSAFNFIYPVISIGAASIAQSVTHSVK